MLDLRNCNATDLEALWKERGSGLTPASLKQTRVDLGKLKVAPKVFQPRDKNEEPWVKEKHIGTLVESLRAGNVLDHIDVFPIAGEYIVVDGHCRLQAYTLARWRGKVPVRILKGSFDDAIQLASEANLKGKLPLTSAEKIERAWSLVLFDEQRGQQFSTRQVAKASGASHGTVSNMRRKLNEFPKGSPDDPRGKTWKEVLRDERGGADFDEEWQSKLRHEWALRLRRAFGDKPDKTPDIFTAAIEEAYPRAFAGMLEQAVRLHPEEAEDLREAAAASDF